MLLWPKAVSTEFAGRGAFKRGTRNAEWKAKTAQPSTQSTPRTQRKAGIGGKGETANGTVFNAEHAENAEQDGDGGKATANGTVCRGPLTLDFGP